jgi:hypothetical protein
MKQVIACIALDLVVVGVNLDTIDCVLAVENVHEKVHCRHEENVVEDLEEELEDDKGA